MMVWRLVPNARARADTLSPLFQAKRGLGALPARQAGGGPADVFALCPCPPQASLGAFHEQVTLELGHRIDDAHGQLAGGGGQVHAAQRQAVHAHASPGRERRWWRPRPWRCVPVGRAW